MGLIKSWIKEMGDTWRGMAEGDAGSFIGVPKSGKRTETRSRGTGTGHVSTPDGSVLNEYQRQMLMNFFHQHYNRYPLSEFEFQQWIRANW
jgi:hypothetical protein